MEQELQNYFKSLYIGNYNGNGYLDLLIIDAITEYYKTEKPINFGYPPLADGWREMSDLPDKPDEYIIAVKKKRGRWGVYAQTYLGDGHWIHDEHPEYWQPLPPPPSVS